MLELSYPQSSFPLWNSEGFIGCILPFGFVAESEQAVCLFCVSVKLMCEHTQVAGLHAELRVCLGLRKYLGDPP